MTATPPRPSRAARVLAVLLPALVLAVSLGVLTFADPPGGGAEWRRAGRTMNGAVFERDVSHAIARDLANGERRVLVLGNSLANANLDPREIARQIAIRPIKVGVIAIPNSVSSHWYAILKNSVFGPGHRPELVVVVAPLQAMLTVEPYSEVSRQNLLVHLQPTEPVLDRYVARHPRWLERWTSQRLLWRQAALDGLRDRAVGLAFGGNTDAAMRRLFRESKLQQLPSDAGGRFVPSAAPSVHDSLLAELATLAEEHGAKLLLVRTPTAPNTPPDLRDVVGEGVAEAATALLASRGHRLLDRSHSKLPKPWFANHRHMTPAGATAFTERIGEDLRQAWDGAKRARRPTDESPGAAP